MLRAGGVCGGKVGGQFEAEVGDAGEVAGVGCPGVRRPPSPKADLFGRGVL